MGVVAQRGGRTYVLLLRGINVGGHRKVPMVDLRALLARLGCEKVRTVLNSGNAVFDVAKPVPPSTLASRIEDALEERFGFRPMAIVMSAETFDVIIAQNGLATDSDNPSRLMVAFLASPAERAPVKALAKQAWGREALMVGTAAAYVWCPDGILESPAFTAVGRALGTAVTTRNWATTLKVQAACRER